MFTKTRVYREPDGWGTVTEVRGNLIYFLYGGDNIPENLLFVRWDNGNGGWVNPKEENLKIETNQDN